MKSSKNIKLLFIAILPMKLCLPKWFSSFLSAIWQTTWFPGLTQIWHYSIYKILSSLSIIPVPVFYTRKPIIMRDSKSSRIITFYSLYILRRKLNKFIFKHIIQYSSHMCVKTADKKNLFCNIISLKRKVALVNY